MNKFKYYYKIKRYCIRKESLENIKINLKNLFRGEYCYSKEYFQLREDRYLAMACLRFLVFDLLFELNPYDEKLHLQELKILDKYFQKYNIDINFVSQDDIDTLFIIIKEI